MQTVDLRRLRDTDASSFRDIRLEGLRDHPEAFGASFGDEQAQSLDRLAERLENGHVIAACTNDAIAGIVGLALSPGEKTRHIGSIWGLYIRPSWRRVGLARRLLEEAIARATDLRPDLRSLRLGVEANNGPAIALYETLGFTPWAVERQALRVGDRFHDEILMRLDFET